MGYPKREWRIAAWIGGVGLVVIIFAALWMFSPAGMKAGTIKSCENEIWSHATDWPNLKTSAQVRDYCERTYGD